MRLSARLSAAVCMSVLVLSSCRVPRMMALLKRPAVTAEDIFEEMRQAHTGGRRLQSLHFMSHDVLNEGLPGLAYPELGSEFTARSRLDFEHGTAWQQAMVRDATVLWSWDGRTLRTERNGRAYPAVLGIDRSKLMRTWLWLLRPSDAALDTRVELTVLARAGGRPRLQVQQLEGSRETWVLELDEDTALVRAVEHTERELRLQRIFRIELDDYRDVGDGVMVAHRMTWMVRAPGGCLLPFHQRQMWNVSAEVAPAFPGPLEPQDWAPLVPQRRVGAVDAVSGGPAPH